MQDGAGITWNQMARKKLKWARCSASDLWELDYWGNMSKGTP